MTFEAILPSLKARKKAVRTGWEGTELYVQLVPGGKFEGDTLNPYFFDQNCRRSFQSLVTD